MSEKATETQGPHLDFEAWRDLVRAMGGRFNPEGVEPKAFTGWLGPINIRGLMVDGADRYFTILQIAGRSAITHNDSAARFDVSDVILVDTTRPHSHTSKWSR